MPLEGVLLLKREWITREMVAMYVDYRGYKGKRIQIHKNQRQGFLLERQVRNIWYSLYQEAQNWREREAKRKRMIRVECVKCGRRDTIVRKVSEWERRKILRPEYRVERKKEQQNWEEVVYPIKKKVQQDSTWTEAPKGAVRERDEQREVKRTFKILREVWLNIRVEKMDIYGGIIVKALLDNGITGMFMDQKITVKHGFRLQKLEKLIVVRNVDGTNNSAGAIIYQVEVNVYYKSHIKRIKIDVYNLGKTDIILEILQLQVHNLEINQETREIKMTRCLPLCGRNMKLKKEKRKRKGKRLVILEEKKMVKQAVDNKED